MVLYFNGKLINSQLRKRFPKIVNHELLFFANKNKMIKAFDMTDNKLLWATESPTETTPTINTELGKIYVQDGLLYSIDLDGKNSNRIFRHFKAKFQGYNMKDAFCNTAVGLNKSKNNSYIYYGCSGKPSSNAWDTG